MRKIAKQVQKVTGDSVELIYVDQGYTGEKPAEDAKKHGIKLEVVKLPQAKRGFVLLPRRWVVERSFAWMARFRRLAKDVRATLNHRCRTALCRVRLFDVEDDVE